MTRAVVGLGVVLAAVVGSASGASRVEAAGSECSVPLALPSPPVDRPGYVLRVRLLPGLRDASGTLVVTFRPEVATDRVVFRLWPNAPFYAARGAALTVGPVSEGGRRLAVRRPNPTTLEVPRRRLPARS